MIKKAAFLVSIALSFVACDDKSSQAPAPAPSGSTPPPAATPSAAPVVSATAAPSASAAPASSNIVNTTDPKAVTITMRDPVAEPQKSVKAAAGGTVTVYMPETPGTVWSVDAPDKALGKPKEETIPGFAPGGVNGHQFTWSTQGAAIKSGSTHKVTLVNKKAGKPNGTFALTIDIL